MANIEFIVEKHFVVDECEHVFSVIEQVAPGVCDLISKTPQDGGPVQNVRMQQYRTKSGKLLYRVPLVRNLLETEVNKIREGVSNYLGKPPGVKYTTINEYKKPAKAEPRSWEESILLTSVARKRHDSWVQEMTDKGWRYGIEENHYNKTHPLLRPWSSLPTETMRKDVEEVKLIRDA